MIFGLKFGLSLINNTLSVEEWIPYEISTHINYTSLSGTAYSNGEYTSSYAAWEALSGIISGNDDSWASVNTTPTPSAPKIWGYQTPVAVRLNSFRIYAPQNSLGQLTANRGIQDFQIQASNDGISWDTLYSGTYPLATALEWGPVVTLPVGSGYTDHRIVITSNWGANPTEIQEIELDMSTLLV